MKGIALHVSVFMIVLGMYLLFLFVYLFFSFSYSNYVVDEKKLHLLKLIMVMNCLVVFSYKGFLENFAGNLSRSGNTPIW